MTEKGVRHLIKQNKLMGVGHIGREGIVCCFALRKDREEKMGLLRPPSAGL